MMTKISTKTSHKESCLQCMLSIYTEISSSIKKDLHSFFLALMEISGSPDKKSLRCFDNDVITYAHININLYKYIRYIYNIP